MYCTCVGHNRKIFGAVVLGWFLDMKCQTCSCVHGKTISQSSPATALHLPSGIGWPQPEGGGGSDGRPRGSQRLRQEHHRSATAAVLQH